MTRPAAPVKPLLKIGEAAEIRRAAQFGAEIVSAPSADTYHINMQNTYFFGLFRSVWE